MSARNAIELLRRMLLIRRMEERLGEVVKSGELPGSVHLYIGQEAVAVGVCAQLSDHDWIASTHRGHGHFLAKGGDPHAMIAEIYGRATGICRGKGGSMHVADFSKGHPRRQRHRGRGDRARRGRRARGTARRPGPRLSRCFSVTAVPTRAW